LRLAGRRCIRRGRDGHGRGAAHAASPREVAEVAAGGAAVVVAGGAAVVAVVVARGGAGVAARGGAVVAETAAGHRV
jgi:hypothetical protein